MVTQANHLDVHEVPDGYIVYQTDQDRVHYLNITSAVIFEFCDGKLEQEEIVARVAKAFNTYGWENFADSNYPGYGGLKPVMFYCSDDDDAKEIVDKLARDLGFDPVDTGGLGMARSLEPLALLWIRLAVRRGRNPNFVWGMMKR